MALRIHLDGVGRLQRLHLHALGDGAVDLHAQRRHVVDAAAVRDCHGLRAGAHGRAGAVHGNVAAADDHDALAREVREHLFADLAQHVDGGDDAVGIAVFKPQRLAGLGADGHVDGIVFLRDARHAVRIHGCVEVYVDVAGGQDGPRRSSSRRSRGKRYGGIP